MKKNIIKLLAILFITLTSCACSNKEMLTTNAFSAFFTNNNFKIIDVSAQYKNNKINNVLIAKKDDYQIEYYVFQDETSTKDYFDNNISKFSSINPIKTEGKNYQKYTFTTSSYQIIISRIENTIIYVEVPIKFQTEINAFLEEINY